MKTAWGWSAKLTRTIVHPEPAKCTRVVSLRPSTITSDVSSRQTKNLEGLRNPASPPQGGGVRLRASPANLLVAPPGER
jgi:hypothetical protein